MKFSDFFVIFPIAIIATIFIALIAFGVIYLCVSKIDPRFTPIVLMGMMNLFLIIGNAIANWNDS